MKDAMKVEGANSGIAYKDKTGWKVDLSSSADRYGQTVENHIEVDGNKVKLFNTNEEGFINLLLEEIINEDIPTAIKTLMDKYDAYRVVGKISDTESLAIINVDGTNLIYGIEDSFTSIPRYTYLGCLTEDAAKQLTMIHPSFTNIEVVKDTGKNYQDIYVARLSAYFDGEKQGIEYVSSGNLDDIEKLMDDINAQVLHGSTTLNHKGFEAVEYEKEPGVWGLSSSENDVVDKMMTALDVRLEDRLLSVPELERANADIPPESLANTVKENVGKTLVATAER